MSVLLVGLAGWGYLAGPGQGSAAGVQLHSTVRDIVRTPSVLSTTSSRIPSVAVSASGQNLQQLDHPSEVFPVAARLPSIRDALPTIGGGLLAFATLVVAVTRHLSRRPQATQLAMAPFLGVVQPTNQTVAEVKEASSSQKTDKGADPNAGASDAATEQHRIDQRVVFNSERWRKHRSGSRFARALGTMPQSYVIQHLVNPVIIISVCTAALCAAQLYFGTEVFNLPTSLFSLSAPSLGLLLVFRTNASYERWDGARKMIGLVKNRSEDMTRQICVRFPANRPELKEQMLRYIQSFFFALKVHLRGGPGGFEDDNNLIEDLTPILKPKELELVLQAQNRPGHIMCCMTQIVKEAGLDGAALFCLDQNLTTLEDVLGGCERILRTPIPLSYTRMTTRFLFAWLLLLPLALSGEILKLDHDIWLTIPAVSFIAFALLGIEEVGVQIEEPFSILPMEAYAEGSRKNTSGIFAQMNDVAQIAK